MIAAQDSASGQLNRNSPSGAHKVPLASRRSFIIAWAFPLTFSFLVFLGSGWSAPLYLPHAHNRSCFLPFFIHPSSSVLSLSLTLSLRCCPQHLRGAVTNCPRKSLSRPHAPPFIFPDSNLLLALLHTCHCVFFLTLESCGKRSVINGVELAGRRSFIMVW